MFLEREGTWGERQSGRMMLAPFTVPLGMLGGAVHGGATALGMGSYTQSTWDLASKITPSSTIGGFARGVAAGVAGIGTAAAAPAVGFIGGALAGIGSAVGEAAGALGSWLPGYASGVAHRNLSAAADALFARDGASSLGAGSAVDTALGLADKFMNLTTVQSDKAFLGRTGRWPLGVAGAGAVIAAAGAKSTYEAYTNSFMVNQMADQLPGSVASQVKSLAGLTDALRY